MKCYAAVSYTHLSRARIRCRQETAAISKNAIPRARKAASQIQYHVRIGESASG